MRKFQPQTAERHAAVVAAYTKYWSRLIEDAHDAASKNESGPLTLSPDDAYRVVERLAPMLHNYPSHLKLTEKVFVKWARACLSSTVFIQGLIRQCEPAVRKAVRIFLAQECGGLGVVYKGRERLSSKADEGDEDSNGETLGTEDEIVIDVWIWALSNLKKIMKPGTAPLPVRLAGQAEFQCRAWKSRAVKEKARSLLRYDGDLDLLYPIGIANGVLCYGIGSFDNARATCLESTQPLYQ
jgi:hypothetical protein